MNNLEAALKYSEMGFSVFPVRRDKKPFFSWEEFQTKRPDVDRIRAMWKDHPDANVAIATGPVSGVGVIDMDSDDAFFAIADLVPDLNAPMVKTPKGRHAYVRQDDDMGNAGRFLPDCDYRGRGGYIVAPPSENAEGKPYQWLPGRAIWELPPAPMPEAIYQCLLKNSILYKGGNGTGNTLPLQDVSTVTNRYINFEKGNRDNTLFHLANVLVKGGMPFEEIQELLTVISLKCCNPPLPERDISIKIQSALKRAQTRERNLKQDIISWVSVTEGYFSVTTCDIELQTVTSQEKANRRVIFHRLVKDGILERDPNRDGFFRRVQTDCPEIDWLSADETPVKVKWPFGLERLAALHEKNLAVIAGTQNAGKTALVLNIALMNKDHFKVRYLSSEMAGPELKGRLKKFDVPLETWKAVDFRERSTNFADAIEPDGLNIIDYYEISAEFWKIAEDLKRIYDKLRKGVAIICLQKTQGKDAGRGGDFGLEKPRLYLNLDQEPPDGAVLTIRKGKNWATPGRNPNWYKTRFKIVDGCKLLQIGNWYLE